jgi:homogentisate phytyltransferase/homogentisate geranylgeranyltransferase
MSVQTLPLVGFSRPHTVIATTLQVITLFLIAGGWGYLDSTGLGAMLIALVSCLAANIYVVGLNQLTDVAIDRINKPELPLAAGSMSPPTARRIVLGSALLSIVLAFLAGPYLLIIVTVVLLVGTAYSLPPLRLKGHAGWAALSIAATRGLIANVGLLLHYGVVLGVTVPTSTLLIVGAFFFGFAIVIALYKDLPDLAGDRMHNIQTLTVRLGPARVVALGRWLLSVCYLLPIGVALAGLPQLAALFLLASHAVIIGGFWQRSLAVRPEQQADVVALYQLLWRMFYAEFVILSIYTLLWSVG